MLSIGLESAVDTLLYGFLAVALAAVSALVVSRYPLDLLRVGRLRRARGACRGLGLRAAELGVWVITWSWIGDLTLWAAVLLLLPDGAALAAATGRAVAGLRRVRPRAAGGRR